MSSSVTHYAGSMRDYGGGLVEVTFGLMVSGARGGERGNAKDPEASRQRGNNRARSEIARKVLAAGLDHLLTMTYAGEGVHDPDVALRDWQRVVKLIHKTKPEWVYTAVMEWHPGGHGLHFHVAVKGWQDVKAIRAAWRAVGGGNIDVEAPKKGQGSKTWQRADLARYMAKYIGKESAVAFGRHRYMASKGITVPKERVTFETRGGITPGWKAAEVLREQGLEAKRTYVSDDGLRGWAASW